VDDRPPAPVLFLVFNRPDLTRRVFDRIREARPARLFIAADGPRAAHPGDAEACRLTRRVAEQVDWPCEVKTLFREANLGCRQAVESAITWFLEHVEAGIILEDDCLPDPTFFPYCTELLERYREDERVTTISGMGYSRPELCGGESYSFSIYQLIWGWATWRRSWQQHQLDISGWQRRLPPKQLWDRAGRSAAAAAYWASTFELLARKQVDTWDGQLVLASMVSGQITATSNVNLIDNIGFGASATHTIEDRHELQPIGRLEFPLAQVPVEVDERADAWTRKHHFRASWRGIFRQAQTYLSHRGRLST